MKKLSFKSLLLVPTLFLFTSCSEFKMAATQLTPSQMQCTGFEKTKQSPIFWSKGFPIEIRLSQSVPESAHDDIAQAINIWNTSLNQNLFTLITDKIESSIEPKSDNKNVIYWFETWPYDFQRLGSTFLYYTENNVTEADIVINAEDYKISSDDELTSSEYDFLSLAVHELGHILGLEHNDDSDFSIMRTLMAPGVSDQTPSATDIENINCMYFDNSSKEIN